MNVRHASRNLPRWSSLRAVARVLVEQSRRLEQHCFAGGDVTRGKKYAPLPAVWTVGGRAGGVVDGEAERRRIARQYSSKIVTD